MRADARWVLLGAAAVVLLAVLPTMYVHQLNALFLRVPGLDKVLHVLASLAVFACAYRLARHVTSDNTRRAQLAVAAGVLIALLDESMQRLVPGRTVEGFDVVANIAGLGLGWAFVAPSRRRIRLGVAAVAVCAAVYVTWHTHALLADYSLGLRHSQQGDFVLAREHFRRALDAGLRSAALYNELGWTEIESGIGDPEQAVEYASTALAMTPDSADVLDTYGWALHHAGRTREAIDALERAYAGDPDIFCIHYHLGAAYLAAGRLDEAESHFRRQLEKPNTREAVLARRALLDMEASW